MIMHTFTPHRSVDPLSDSATHARTDTHLPRPSRWNPGGISPITKDFVNPEKPWPHLRDLSEVTASAGFELVPRLPIYPEFIGLLGVGASRRDGPRKALQADDGPSGRRSGFVSDAETKQDLAEHHHQAWLDESGGRASVRAVAMRLSDSSGYVRGVMRLYISRVIYP